MSREFLLDTNIPSELARLSPDPRVVAWLVAQNAPHLSVVTIGELRKGFALLPESRRRTELEQWFEQVLLPLVAGRVIPVSYSICERWGVLSAKRQLSGRPLAMADGLIAATALEYDLTLVTRNVKDFVDLDIRLLNPWETT